MRNDLSTERAGISGMLRDFHLFDLLTQGGTITLTRGIDIRNKSWPGFDYDTHCSVLPCDTDFLCTFGLGKDMNQFSKLMKYSKVARSSKVNHIQPAYSNAIKGPNLDNIVQSILQEHSRVRLTMLVSSFAWTWEGVAGRKR